MTERCPDCQHPVEDHTQTNAIKVFPTDPEMFITRCRLWDCLMKLENSKCTKIEVMIDGKLEPYEKKVPKIGSARAPNPQ